MEREVRKIQNIKQTVIDVKSGGIPSAGEISKPEIRYINGYGMYLIAKYNGKLWFSKMESDINNA